MKKRILFILMLILSISMLSFSGRNSREQNIKYKKEALERKYQKCMTYSEYKVKCAKYREIKEQIK